LSETRSQFDAHFELSKFAAQTAADFLGQRLDKTNDQCGEGCYIEQADPKGPRHQFALVTRAATPRTTWLLG